MKTIKEKFITYLGNIFTQSSITEKIYRNNGKFNFYVLLYSTDFENGIVENYYLLYKSRIVLSFNDLNNDLNIIYPEKNEIYLNFIKDGKDILKHFRNKELIKRLNKKLLAKNKKQQLKKI